MVEFEKLLYVQPRLKINWYYFSLRKPFIRVQCLNEFTLFRTSEVLRHEMVSDNVVLSDLLSQEKSPSQAQLIKIASRRFLSTMN